MDNEVMIWIKKLQRLCSKKEYCRFEIVEKLKKSSLTDEQKDKIITSLLNEGFIDEKRYVNSFVHDKIWLNKWGKQKVKQFLLLKEIDEALIDATLAQIEHHSYLNIFLPLAKKKWMSLKDDYSIKKQKWTRFLLQRGLSYSDVEELFKLIHEE